jgi:hypothetical protein
MPMVAEPNGRLVGLYDNGCALVNVQFHRLAIAKIQERIAGDGSFVPAAAGKVPHAAKR